ncbi:DUF1924 domain-containing protein [Lamprocystis purpurea]|jgi:hypothetical protein|uniref:DUF1924 domain-containing protein n=1 Tax=Lamprocystis purpurea TaxID=61598 RepID=UPI00037E7596|nr:DUF1924 domain-containing protein [Lamprocystis purpurea]
MTVKPISVFALAVGLGLGTQLVSAATGDDLIATYQGQGAGPFSAAAGARAWTTKHQPEGAGEQRSCVTCHGTDLTKPGKHATTGKPIEPLAVSANSERLTDPAKVEKWFGRNCRWTLGRDCTPQEKGDFVRYIQSL